jgi:hypothetical protein
LATVIHAETDHREPGIDDEHEPRAAAHAVLRLDMFNPVFYLQPMTKLLDEAIAEIRRLPPEQQDDIGRYLLQLAAAEPLDADTIAALDEAEAQIARGEVVRGEDLKAFWRSLLPYGRRKPYRA